VKTNESKKNEQSQKFMGKTYGKEQKRT